MMEKRGVCDGEDTPRVEKSAADIDKTACGSDLMSTAAEATANTIEVAKAREAAKRDTKPTC